MGFYNCIWVRAFLFLFIFFNRVRERRNYLDFFKELLKIVVVYVVICMTLFAFNNQTMNAGFTLLDN